MKIGTLFSGFEGVSIGAQQAGIEHAWGIEYDAGIAQVANDNGFDVTALDILEADPRTFERVDILHASPPCPNFSVAKFGAKETKHDRRMADKVGEFISALRPRIFTLENVSMYRQSKSFATIMRSLASNGYFAAFQLVNAADYGVPQTRRRLWLYAVRGGLLPALPPAEPWCGWYVAIADLIPSLPDSELAPWQIARLPTNIGDVLIDDQNGAQFASDEHRGLTVREASAPSFTISATQTKRSIRAIVGAHCFALNARAIARLQTFPDWYQLPDNNALATRGIGNAVPPLLYQKLITVLL